MEKNVFYIQINSMGQKVDIPLNAVRNLSQEEQKVLVDSMYTPIDDAQAEEIMNSSQITHEKIDKQTTHLLPG